jgi:hypothetical protein
MENIEITYPARIKYENFTKKPKKQSFIVPLLIPMIAPLLMIGKKHTLTKVNMESFTGKNRKHPFFLLYTHMQFVDMPMFLKAALPRKSNNVAAIDTFRGMFGVLQSIGRSIPARKFANNIALFRNAVHVLKNNKSVFGMAAEAQYSPNGLTQIIPDSIGKMIKLLKAPVVTLNMHGNYINNPTWGDQKARNEIPLKPVMTYTLTPEDIEKMSTEEINTKIRELLDYNEWKYWQESGIKVTYKNRAVGIEHILYKCPVCGAEFEMTTSGSYIKCNKCEKEWELTENGFLVGTNHETKFNSPDLWTLWEREEVRKELLAGTYCYEERLPGHSMPNRKQYFNIGEISVKHTPNGFEISGNHNNADFHFYFSPKHSYNIQREFNAPQFKNDSVIGLSTATDTLFFAPGKKGMCYKIEIAVQELYKIKKQ